MPTILSSSSLRKPFMTESTTISVATPSMMPRNEKPGDDRDEAFAAARAQVAPGEHPLEGREGLRAGRCASALRHRPDQARFSQPRDDVARAAATRCSPVARRFSLDLALGQALRADHDLPGNADEVGGRELRAGTLVAVVVEHVEAGRRRARDRDPAQAASVAASPAFRFRSATSKGATGIRPDDAVLVVARLDDRGDRRVGPMP